MEVAMSVKGSMNVRPHTCCKTREIVARVKGECPASTLRLYLPYEKALELASKIESCYQGIVGPVEPEPAEYVGEPYLPDRRPA